MRPTSRYQRRCTDELPRRKSIPFIFIPRKFQWCVQAKILNYSKEKNEQPISKKIQRRKLVFTRITEAKSIAL